MRFPRLPEAVTSAFVLHGVVLGGHYHQSIPEALLFLFAGTFWLIVLHLLKRT